jgi:hypothetical protein
MRFMKLYELYRKKQECAELHETAHKKAEEPVKLPRYHLSFRLPYDGNLSVDYFTRCCGKSDEVKAGFLDGHTLYGTCVEGFNGTA